MATCLHSGRSTLTPCLGSPLEVCLPPIIMCLVGVFGRAVPSVLIKLLPYLLMRRAKGEVSNILIHSTILLNINCTLSLGSGQVK